MRILYTVSISEIFKIMDHCYLKFVEFAERNQMFGILLVRKVAIFPNSNAIDITFANTVS